MFLHRKRIRALKLSLLASFMLAGCAQQQSVPNRAEQQPASVAACQPAQADDQLVGNWLSKRQEKDVAGELRTLFTLQQSGQMAYTEQLKRPGQPSQGLSEVGCWSREGTATVVLETRESNGSAVDTTDPIFSNRFTIESLGAERLVLSSSSGVKYVLTRTSQGYRLPF